MMNSVILIGRLTKDPELRFIPSGKAVATFGLAVKNSYSKEKQVDFFNIVVWGKTAENCANYLAKGRLVGVKGRLQTRNYENKQGIKVYITEIVADQVEFLEWGDKPTQSQKQQQPSNNDFSQNDFNKESIDLKDFEEIDEDIPF
ncbi:MAG: single-stranded DNA-binding protein [Clostridiales bacterium]|nr:single-stranded DNA-binding protein [Clostridiales bacterium]